MDTRYSSRIRIILCILTQINVVFCLNPARDNVCLTVRLEHLSSCKAFILYSNRCAEFIDSQVCDIIHSKGNIDTGAHNVSVEFVSLLSYNCCPGFMLTGEVDYCQACPENTFGLGCRGECQCQSGATCSPIDGSCECPAGWNGTYCERTCPEGFYGDGCMHSCPDCGPYSFCDHVDGHCICPPGFGGHLCTEKCIAGVEGALCGEICDLCPENCGYETCCDIHINTCICGPGWKGRYCTEPCELETFGVLCNNTCQCEHDAICLHENGKCVCMPGWKGKNCSEPCEQGFYGNQCLEKCNCPYNTSCDHVTGVCDCKGDWQGSRCNEVSYCKPGENCQPANGTCIADEEELILETNPPIKVGIAAGAGAATFLFLVVFAIYCMKRTRVQPRSFMETKLPLFSNGPQPPPRPPQTRPFNNEPVYDSIGEDGHYIEIIDNKPSGIYNPEYIISGGEGYLIPSTRPGLTDHDDTTGSQNDIANASHSAGISSSSSFSSGSSFDGSD